jgi:TDG/mug DNA glycosylase family protein
MLGVATAREKSGDHRITLRSDGHTFNTLADLSCARGGILFVGLNPSPASVKAGHYHQGPLGKRFWSRLVEAAILPPHTLPETADDALVPAGHGITDLLKGPTARDRASEADLAAGVAPLARKVATWKPSALVFIYKRAAQVVAGRRLRQRSGPLDGLALAGCPCFLMPAISSGSAPSPSSRA